MNADFKLNGIVLESKRLILRPWRQEDLDDFFEYASVEGVGEMAGWFHHKSKEESQQILNMFIQEDRVFAICLKENNKVIGSLGIEKYGMEDKLSEFDGYIGREIGYALSKDYWGQGYMPEAVETVIYYLFNELKYDFLTCGYFDFNAQSKRVQEKCGFKPYRKLVMDTQMGTKEPGVLNLMTNPKKDIVFNFSHPETLIINKEDFMSQPGQDGMGAIFICSRCGKSFTRTIYKQSMCYKCLSETSDVTSSLRQFIGCIICFNKRLAMVVGARSNYDGDWMSLQYLDSDNSFEVNAFDDELFEALPDNPKYGLLKRKDDEIVFLYNDIEYVLGSNPNEPCIYIKKDGEIFRTLHNGFDVYDLPEYFAKGNTLELGNLVFDREGFCKVLAAAIDSDKTEMDFDYAAKISRE